MPVLSTIRFPLVDGAGEIVAVGGVSADITAEREAIRFRDDAIEELKLSREETVERLARAIDRHDASTGQHVNRLAALTAFLAEEATRSHLLKLGMQPMASTPQAFADYLRAELLKWAPIVKAAGASED